MSEFSFFSQHVQGNLLIPNEVCDYAVQLAVFSECVSTSIWSFVELFYWFCEGFVVEQHVCGIFHLGSEAACGVGRLQSSPRAHADTA